MLNDYKPLVGDIIVAKFDMGEKVVIGKIVGMTFSVYVGRKETFIIKLKLLPELTDTVHVYCSNIKEVLYRQKHVPPKLNYLYFFSNDTPRSGVSVFESRYAQPDVSNHPDRDESIILLVTKVLSPLKHVDIRVHLDVERIQLEYERSGIGLKRDRDGIWYIHRKKKFKRWVLTNLPKLQQTQASAKRLNALIHSFNYLPKERLIPYTTRMSTNLPDDLDIAIANQQIDAHHRELECKSNIEELVRLSIEELHPLPLKIGKGPCDIMSEQNLVYEAVKHRKRDNPFIEPMKVIFDEPDISIDFYKHFDELIENMPSILQVPKTLFDKCDKEIPLPSSWRNCILPNQKIGNYLDTLGSLRLASPGLKEKYTLNKITQAGIEEAMDEDGKIRFRRRDNKD